jgi:hypothetical protein
MKILTNDILDKALGLRGYDFIKQTITLPAELQTIIDSGFHTEGDCILLKHFSAEPVSLDSDHAKTEYENTLNDIHIDNYTTEVTDEFEYLKVGLEFSKRLYHKLKENHQVDFRIILSFSETTRVGEEVDFYGGCVVKFHKIRPACDHKFKLEDLNKFQLEGVIVIE